MTPDDVANTAVKYGAHGIAYTYNEPSIFIEFARDCGIAARKKGLFNVFVSNGYDTPESVSMMSEFLDGITIDFKGNAEKEFTRKFISAFQILNQFLTPSWKLEIKQKFTSRLRT